MVPFSTWWEPCRFLFREYFRVLLIFFGDSGLSIDLSFVMVSLCHLLSNCYFSNSFSANVFEYGSSCMYCCFGMFSRHIRCSLHLEFWSSYSSFFPVNIWVESF